MTTKTNMQPERRSAMIESGAWNDNIITDYLDQAVLTAPDSVAVIAYRVNEDERLAFSYRELDHLVTRMAAGLAGLGVAKSDVVSCQLPNGWQITALHLACVRIGAILNPLMPIFRERELAFMLGHAQSRVLVIPHHFRGFDYAAMVQGMRGELPALDRRQVFPHTVQPIDWSPGAQERACRSRLLVERQRAESLADPVFLFFGEIAVEAEIAPGLRRSAGR